MKTACRPPAQSSHLQLNRPPQALAWCTTTTTFPQSGAEDPLLVLQPALSLLTLIQESRSSSCRLLTASDTSEAAGSDQADGVFPSITSLQSMCGDIRGEQQMVAHVSPASSNRASLPSNKPKLHDLSRRCWEANVHQINASRCRIGGFLCLLL